MIVVITSLAPVAALSTPAIAPHSAPARHESTIVSTMCRKPFMCGSEEPIHAAR